MSNARAEPIEDVPTADDIAISTSSGSEDPTEDDENDAVNVMVAVEEDTARR